MVLIPLQNTPIPDTTPRRNNPNTAKMEMHRHSRNPQDMLNTRIIEIEEVDILAKTDGEIEQTSELYPVSIQESNRLLKTAVS